MTRILYAVMAAFLLSACAQQPPQSPVPRQASVGTNLSDPLACGPRSDCTTKVSRTLLFVFDYAAAGAPLVLREGNLLFTPENAPRSDWPAIRIELAQPIGGRFVFSSACKAKRCRYDEERLLRIYQSYLVDKPCSFQLPSCQVKP